MKTKTYLLFCLFLLATVGHSQTIEDAFLKVQNNQLIQLDKPRRMQLMQNIADTSRVETFLQDTCVAYKTSNHSIKLKYSDLSSIEFVMQVGKHKNDTAYYLLKTYNAPEAETVITKYDRKLYIVGSMHVPDEPISFLIDTLSFELREEAMRYVDYKMYKVEYDPVDNTLIASLSLCNLSKEEKSKAEGYFQRKKMNFKDLILNKR